MLVWTRSQMLLVPCDPVTLWPVVWHSTLTCADLPAIPTTAPVELGVFRTFRYPDEIDTVPRPPSPVHRYVTSTHELFVSASASQNVPSARSMPAGLRTVRPNWSFPPL